MICILYYKIINNLLMNENTQFCFMMQPWPDFHASRHGFPKYEIQNI